MKLFKELNKIDFEEDTFYYSDEMLKYNIMIHEETHMHDDRVDTYISVKHYNEIDASERTIYWDRLLSSIQVYRIVKDIYELFEENPVNEFLDIIEDLSSGGISAAMQSKLEHKENIRKDIERDFDTLRTEIALK